MSTQDGVQMDLMGYQSLTHARWRYSLISEYIGTRILEVGSADRDFTWVLSQEKQAVFLGLGIFSSSKESPWYPKLANKTSVA